MMHTRNTVAVEFFLELKFPFLFFKEEMIAVGKRVGQLFVWMDLVSAAMDRGVLRSLLMNSTIAEMVDIDDEKGIALSQVDTTWAMTAEAERRAVVEIIGGSTQSSSLVEIPPLVIAAIVGGVALAAVAAAAVAFLGVAGLTVGLLWAFGVFNSHKDRRRKNDRAGACESTNPLDTNDPDCFTLRFNKIASYFRYHTNLKKLERGIVHGQEEITSLWDDAYMKSEQLSDQIYGPGGTVQRPNSAKGLIHDTNLDLDASKQLQAAEVTSVSLLFDTQLRMADDASADVGAFKVNLAQAYSNLTDDAEHAVQRQEEMARLNAALMSGSSTKALADSLEEIIPTQKDSSAGMLDVYKGQQRAVSDVAFNRKVISRVLDDADQTVDKLGHAIDTRVQSLQTRTDASTSLTLKEVTQASVDAERHATTELDLLTRDFASTTLGQVKTSKSGWQSDSSSAMLRTKALADALDDQLLIPAVTNQSLILGNSSAVVTDHLGSLQSNLLVAVSDNQRTARTLSRSTTGLSSNTSTATDNVKSGAQEVSVYIDNSLMSIRKKIASYLGSLGYSSDTISSLVSAIGSAQQDSVSSLIKGQNGYTGDIAGSLESLAQNGFNTGQSAQSLYSLLQTGTAKTNADMMQIIQSALAGSKVQGSQLMEAADRLGIQTGALSTQQGDVIKLLQNELGGNVKMGSSDLLSALFKVQSTGNLQSNSLMDTILSRSRKWMGSTSSSQVTAGGLMSSIKSGSSQNTIVQSVMSRLMDGDSSAITGLATVLAGGDEAVATSISRQLRTAQNLLSQSSTAIAGQTPIRRIVRSAMKELDLKRGSVQNVSSTVSRTEAKTLDQTKSIVDQVKALLGETDTYNSKTDFSRSSIKSKLGRQFTDLESQSGNSIIAVQTSAGPGMNFTVMSSVQAMLKALLDSAGNDFKRLTDGSTHNSRNLQDSATQLSVDDATLAGLIDAIGSNSASSLSSVKNALNRIFGSLGSNSGSFSTDLSSMSSQLEAMKSTTATALQNISRSVESEILSIPLMIVSGTAALDRDMELVSSDLSRRIRETREAMGSARTTDEKLEAARGLEVLLKLQAVQQGVFQADKSLRSSLNRHRNVSVEDQNQISGSLGVVLGALSSLNRGLDSTRLDPSIGLDTNQLLNELGLLINSSGQAATADAAQSVLLQALRLSQQQSRLNKTTTATSGGLVRSDTATEQYWTWNAGQVANISDLISSTKIVAKQAGEAQSEVIDQVLANVDRGLLLVQRNLSVIEDDVLTRIGLVRMAMASFLSLWNEFSLAADSKHFGMMISDREFLAGMETNMKRELMRAESIVNGTGSSLNSLKAIIKSVDLSEHDFERSFGNDMKSLVTDLGSINARRNGQMMTAIDALGDAINLENSDGDSRLDSIDSILNEFESIVNDYTT